MVNSLPIDLRELYPFTPRVHNTNGGARMSYVDEGQGSEAVLMLHGNPTWSCYFSGLIKAVAPQLRCIAPDHIGMGLSDKPPNYSYQLNTRIEDIASLVKSLQLKRVHLVLHDWGGAIGFGFAARHPELIGRIVVLNTAAFPAPHLPWRIAACKLPLIGPWLVRGANGFAGPAISMAMHRRKLSPAEIQLLLLPYDSWANRVAVNAFVRDIPMNSVHPSWQTLQAVEQGIAQFARHPALIVWGGRDFCFNDYFYSEWQRRLPQAHSEYIPDAGHYVLLDADRVAVPRIASFLTAPDQERP